MAHNRSVSRGKKYPYEMVGKEIYSYILYNTLWYIKIFRYVLKFFIAALVTAIKSQLYSHS